MRIEHLDISETVADKIVRKHGVTPEEVGEIFWNEYDQVRFRRSNKVRDTYLAFGRTEAGRYLTVVFAPEPGYRARVITARDMTSNERRLYRK